MRNILIIDNDTVFRSSLKVFLENHKYKVGEAGSVKAAIKNDLMAFNAIVSDGEANLDIIKVARGVPVIVTSSKASLRSAVEVMKLGAADYLPKPYNLDELKKILEALITQPRINHTEMLGGCSSIRSLSVQLAKVAPTYTNVLIEGESGTGKELVARKIHQLSNRADRQMISLNCAAIPDSFIESELFGHEKGAFSGATTARVGLVEAADGSTLFLDEIGELPLSAQARLLRVLQEGEVRSVGSIETQKVSVRLIASTHRNLQALVNDGEFREDLYYRLNVMKFSLPPLRERGDDITILAEHFLATHAETHGRTRLKFSNAASKCIHSYNWPGNIRELENAIQRAVILCDGKTIGPKLLAIEPVQKLKFPSYDIDNQKVSLEDYFVNFVLENQDQMTETELAQKLGISRKALWQKRQKLGIPREKSRLR
ncbi:MAG: sigma-54-dependent transcriptional regulator [Candidatus Azotimanducaceae bacterium WSBS_2022_MAG_OTU7]